MNGTPDPKKPRTTVSQSWGSAHGSREACVNSSTFTCQASVTDSASPDNGEDRVIATGIAFLDHMVDQLTAHGQFKIGLRTFVDGCPQTLHSNALRPQDDSVVPIAGAALGAALAALLSKHTRSDAHHSETFYAPLDESFTQFTIDFSSVKPMFDLSLAPYGAYPARGREYVGSLRTALVEVFFRALALEMKCGFSIQKVRGDNAHHIIEATFKSFARCLRAAMDTMIGFEIASWAGPTLREAHKQRSTKETNIDVSIKIDGVSAPEAISTGISMLDTLLKELQSCAEISLHVSCSGDTWIDDHHSSEDVCITIGKVLAEALGTKAGAVRMACAHGDCNGTQVLCVMDLSNRPSYHSGDLFSACEEEMAGDISVEMLEHCLDSFVINSLMTVHLMRKLGSAPSATEVATAAFRAVGFALRKAISIDPRRGGVTASSKGTLSK